jgi:undecaprenyl-diphosphatase
VLLTAPVVWAADGISSLLKDAVDRPRPHFHPLIAVPSSPAFPSGHTTTSFAGAAMLTWFFPRWWPGFYALAAAVGYSRLYNGVHWPYDVLGGALLGTAVAAAAIASLRLLARSRPRLRAALRRG